MQRLRTWRWGLPLIALVALAGWFVVRQTRDEGVSPPRLPSQEARPPDAARQPGTDSGEAGHVPQAPVTFKAVRDGERITLSGSVSAGEARDVLLKAAGQAVPNAVVVDDLKATETAAPGSGAAAAFAVRQLARLPAASVEVREGAIVLAGEAPDAEAYNAVASAIEKPPESYRLDLAGLVPPIARPYTWSAIKNEKEIVLKGHVPSEAVRQSLRAAAGQAFPEKQLVDSLQPASGLPAIDFNGATRFALTQLALLQAGTADLADATLSLRGDVTDKDTLARVRAALRDGLPPGLQSGSVMITIRPPSPYAFRAYREPGTLTLTGYYPDEATRAAIHDLIRKRFFGERIVDRLRAADGAPKSYLAGVSFGLEHLARLAAGEVAVSDTSVQVSGEALYEQTAEQTARAVRAVSLPGWTGKADVRLREKASAEP